VGGPAFANHDASFTAFMLLRHFRSSILCSVIFLLTHLSLLHFQLHNIYSVFTMLHVMQTQYSDENSVCPSVCHTRVLW